MNPTELRELDAWICLNAMGWIETTMNHLEHKGRFCVFGGEVLIHNRGNNVKTFHPTTDRAAAMEVLERCTSKCGCDIRINRDRIRFYVYTADSITSAAKTCSDTLPLAICLFARELFKEESK